MGIQCGWDNDEHTVFRYSFDKKWSWEDFFAAKEKAWPELDATPHKFAILIDATLVSQLPPNALANARNALRSGHPRASVVVLVVRNPVVRSVIGTLRNVAPLSPRRVDIVATLDEARALIAERLLADPSTGG
jgi:hypothetical protein